MHFVVKAPNLAHMYMTPKTINLAIVPSQISPVEAVAAILKNGRNLTISQKLIGVALSLSTLYRFSGEWISEKLLPDISCHCIRHVGAHFKKWPPFPVICLIFETLRHRIVTLVSTHIIYGQCI